MTDWINYSPCECKPWKRVNMNMHVSPSWLEDEILPQHFALLVLCSDLTDKFNPNLEILNKVGIM